MQSSWVAITWSVAVISILFLRQNIPLCDLWKQVWGWRWVAVCQIDDETYADGHCRRLWHRNLHFAMHCLVDRKYTTSEQYKSLKLLFTKTWLILIYSAKIIYSFEPCSTSEKSPLNICKGTQSDEDVEYSEEAFAPRWLTRRLQYSLYSEENVTMAWTMACASQLI